MIVIDGAQGEGGGQIFRSSLSLSMCLGKPVRIINIRAKRTKPGLLRQHLTCLRAAKTICDAQITGDELGSREVTFIPGKVGAGNYDFKIGSAGSTSLVFQTVLMPLLLAGGNSEISLEGGTHNGAAPSYDFIHLAFLPLLKRMGYWVDVELKQHGFYPAGGGLWMARLLPARAEKPLQLNERGAPKRRQAVATSSRIPEQVNQRELARVQKKCGWADDELMSQMVASPGPGNIISLRYESEHVTEVFESVGEKQLSSERVAGKAIKALKAYLSSEAAVGEYLADQLLLRMVLGSGGQFTTVAPSQHFYTNVHVIQQFMNVDIQAEKINDHVWKISV